MKKEQSKSNEPLEIFKKAEEKLKKEEIDLISKRNILSRDEFDTKVKLLNEDAQKYQTERRKWFDEIGTMITNPDAMKYMEEATFTQNLHGISKNIQDLVNKYPIMKQVMPFVKTPLNLFKATMDRIPVAGMLRREFRDDFLGISGNPYRMAEARGKQAIGTAILVMASFVFKDRITGG